MILTIERKGSNPFITFGSWAGVDNIVKIANRNSKSLAQINLRHGKYTICYTGLGWDVYCDDKLHKTYKRLKNAINMVTKED